MIDTRHEVSANNSHAVMATEISDLRTALRDLIIAGKQTILKLPSSERPALIDALLKAEWKLK